LKYKFKESFTRKEAPMAAYVITFLDVTDPNAFEEYRRAAGPTFAPYGGKPIVVDGRFEVLEGMIHRARSWSSSSRATSGEGMVRGRIREDHSDAPAGGRLEPDPGRRPDAARLGHANALRRGTRHRELEREHEKEREAPHREECHKYGRPRWRVILSDVENPGTRPPLLWFRCRLFAERVIPG